MTERVISGLHAAQSALEHGPERVSGGWVDRQRLQRRDKRIILIHELLLQHNIVTELVDSNALDRLAGNRHHQGVVLHFEGAEELDENALKQALEQSADGAFYLVLDHVQDPHNLGACLRTADAVGVQGIITTKDQSVGLTPVVCKVASGAAETVPLYRVTNLARTLRLLKKAGVWIIGTAGEADKTAYQSDLTGPVAIVMGAEGDGMRRLTREQCDFLIKLPMRGSVESLNISVAAGVVLYEVVRQRGIETKD